MTQAQAGEAQPPVRSRGVTLTLPQLWAWVSLAGIFIILALSLIRPHDFWWHVGVGQWTVDSGRVPQVELFSFTRAGEPYAYQMWLMEVVFYLLLRAGGLPLVILFHALVITAAYGLLLRVNQRAAGGNLRWAALATLAAAAIGFDSWNVRPQTLSILLFSLTLYLLERHEWRQATGRSGRPTTWLLWCLPLVFALWANAHGAFVSGLALLGAYLLAELLAWLRRQRPFPIQLSVVTLLSAAATLFTPLGLGMVDYVLGIARNPVIRRLTVEWMSPTIQGRAGFLFFGFVILLIVLLLVSRYRPSPHETIRLLLFGGLALMARRNTIWFGFVAAPTMAAALDHWASRRGPARDARPGQPRLNRAVALLVGLLALLSLPWFRPYLPLPQERRAYLSSETPVQAVAALRELSGPRRIFHSEDYGSYMIWASPELPVFIDTRMELYPPEQWLDYIAVSQARYDWEAILERYGVDTLLLERQAHGPLIEAATAAPGWLRTYEDEQAVIFQRGTSP